MKKVKQRNFLGGYWFGIYRVFARDNEDATRIYKNVVEAKGLTDADMQDVNDKVSREDFDTETVKFYSKQDKSEMEYCEDRDGFFSETEIDIEEPEEVEPTEAMSTEEMHAAHLKEAEQTEKENPSKETPDADQVEIAKSEEKNQLPPEEQKKDVPEETGQTQVENAETGDEDPLIKDIKEGDAESSILGKYDKDDFVRVAESLSIPSEGTKQSLLTAITNQIKQ